MSQKESQKSGLTSPLNTNSPHRKKGRIFPLSIVQAFKKQKTTLRETKSQPA
jgi:hypothetical protein